MRVQLPLDVGARSFDPGGMDDSNKYNPSMVPAGMQKPNRDGDVRLTPEKPSSEVAFDGQHNPSMAPPMPKAAQGEGDGGASPGSLLGVNVDVLEHGAQVGGRTQAMDRRLFMQLMVWDVAPTTSGQAVAEQLSSTMREQGIGHVVYADVNQPRGVAVLTWAEDPAHFVQKVRGVYGGEAFKDLTLRPGFSMLGRTYSQGYEQDLEQWLLRRPVQTVTHEQWPWAVWYPLRRTGAFAALDPREQSKILKEHAIIGRAYGSKDLAHDVRLACHGLDESDNEFVIGLVGEDLHRLSHVVQTMRGTKQTSEYIAKMGPFFVGRVLHAFAG